MKSKSRAKKKHVVKSENKKEKSKKESKRADNIKQALNLH